MICAGKRSNKLSAVEICCWKYIGIKSKVTLQHRTTGWVYSNLLNYNRFKLLEHFY